MKMRLPLLILAVLAAWLSATAATASLGDLEDSIETDRASISGRRAPPEARAGCTVHEVTADAVTVREFTAPSGVVFGVAWNGISTPDLTQFFGSYAAEYSDAAKSARIPGRKGLTVRTNRIVVERWGHMRNLQGRAYVPALVPPGVNVDEIR